MPISTTPNLPSPNFLKPIVLPGRVHENSAERGSPELVEGFHAVLRSYRSPHRSHVRIPRAAQQGIRQDVHRTQGVDYSRNY